MLEKFERKEIKYKINKCQYNEIIKVISNYMVKDKYYKSKIKNIYFDTPDYLLIRKSIEKPIYKEKLRVRSYGDITYDDTVFLELKKKYKGTVYKRRIKIIYKDLYDILDKGPIEQDSQVLKEIKYFINFYKNILPKVMISYNRESFKLDGQKLRITFDSNISYREDMLDLTINSNEERLLNDDEIIMEIKTSLPYPRWLLDILNKEKIYKTSYSKYGNIYKKIFLNKNTKE